MSIVNDNMNTPETDAEHAQFAMGGFTLDFCRKLERERNKAREKIERQRERIAYLEGATHHACGTPLSKAIKERDEAIAARKASAADWLLQVENAERRVSEAKKMAARAVQDAAALADKLSGLELRSTEELARLEQERDEAREALDEEMKFHHRTHGECVIAQCQLMDVTNERDEARHEIEGWKNKWECAVDMAARAENQRDEYRALLIRIYNDINVLHTGDAIRELTREFKDENFN